MEALKRALVLAAVGGAYMAAVALTMSIAASWKAEAAAAAKAAAKARALRRLRKVSAPAEEGYSGARSGASSESGARSGATTPSVATEASVATSESGATSTSGARSGATSESGATSASGARSGATPETGTRSASDDDELTDWEVELADSESDSGAEVASSDAFPGHANQGFGGAFVARGQPSANEELSYQEFLKRVTETLAAAEAADAKAREAIAATYAAREDLQSIVQQVEHSLGFPTNSPGGLL